MPYSPRIFALVMASFISIAAIKLVFGGYLLATMDTEEQLEQQARKFAASMLPRERPEVQEAAGYLATLGQLRAHNERFNRGLDSLTTGGFLVVLVMIVLGERRARLGRTAPSGVTR
ncbi:hypothetical protein [Arenimonas metalli]|uniref:Uncharacterized protein n=1 Tax=Arenimonas metalli CF5-1 TaxID=1384056 RepID=A0A091B3K8_9GAMM|nr:hypothetical protein [Arenimonas metalli]KFN46147.1 hypothetical protein N787_11315 [Arenimonas metalli CF5-1]